MEKTGFAGGSVVKNLPAVQETWIQCLDWEDALEKGKVIHSSILYSPWGCKELDMTEQLSLSLFFTSHIILSKINRMNIQTNRGI